MCGENHIIYLKLAKELRNFWQSLRKMLSESRSNGPCVPEKRAKNGPKKRVQITILSVTFI